MTIRFNAVLKTSSFPYRRAKLINVRGEEKMRTAFRRL